MQKLIFSAGLLIVFLSACANQTGVTRNDTDATKFTNLDAETVDYLGITDVDHLSAASKRALAWP